MKTKLFLATLLLPIWIFGQVFIPGDFHNPINKSQDSTTLTFFSSIKLKSEEGFEWNDIFFKTTHNSAYARGYNDGPVWKGDGFTVEVHSGFTGKLGKLSYTVNPVIFLSENRHFYIPNLEPSTSEFAYPYTDRIDWVQRYGDEHSMNFHPGQSEIRLNLGKVFASIGSQNFSLGPSVYNPIMLSRQAGGFPHFRIGVVPTYITKKKSIGKVEANLLFGLLKESDYFDSDPDNDTRYLNGLSVAIVPSFLPNATIGFNKFLYKQTRFFQGRDLFSTFFIIDDGVIDGDTLSPNDTFDQMASFTFEWNFVESGFRAYVEFAKNDFTSGGGGLRPTATEPEHSRGYTIGFEKTIQNKRNADFIISYEHTNLSIGHQPWRPTPPFFAHGINKQGYTHDGQIIGAGIGPGGNSDHLGIRMIKGTFSGFLLLQRIERDRDYFVRQIRNLFLHNIEYSSTLAVQKGFDKFDFFAEATYSYNYAWNFKNNAIWNMSVGFGGRYKL
ncbi:MAG: hypothetical protein ABJG78_04580 [Cyclobacteriaceae bacterium]